MYYLRNSLSPFMAAILTLTLHSSLCSFAEHLFQSLKFPHRPDIAKAVRKAETPSEAVKLARRHAADVRRGWRQEGLNVIAMREVLLLKFTQHSALRSRLLQTGE